MVSVSIPRLTLTGQETKECPLSTCASSRDRRANARCRCRQGRLSSRYPAPDKPRRFLTESRQVWCCRSVGVCCSLLGNRRLNGNFESCDRMDGRMGNRTFGLSTDDMEASSRRFSAWRGFAAATLRHAIHTERSRCSWLTPATGSDASSRRRHGYRSSIAANENPMPLTRGI